MDIAHGEVSISLNDAQAIAGIERFEQKFDRAMAEISHKRAEADIDANLRPLERKLALAKAELRALEGESVDVDLDADDTGLKEKLESARREVKRADGQVAKKVIELEGHREFI